MGRPSRFSFRHSDARRAGPKTTGRRQTDPGWSELNPEGGAARAVTGVGISNPAKLAVARLSAQTILTDTEAAVLLALPGLREDVRPGASLIQAGSEATSACVLSEGIVARTLEGADGSRQITTFYFTGDLRCKRRTYKYAKGSDGFSLF